MVYGDYEQVPDEPEKYFTQYEFFERLRDFYTYAERNGLNNTLFGISTVTKKEYKGYGWYSVGIYDYGRYVPLFDIYLGNDNNFDIANDYIKQVCKEIGVQHVQLV